MENELRVCKALSIRQPYAWLIVTGQKTIENRSWSTRYRGPLLIHAASMECTRLVAHLVEQKFGIAIDKAALVRGGVVGIVELVDVVTASSSPWFEGPYGWVLQRPRLLPFHVLRGQQRFFYATVDLGIADPKLAF